MNGNDILKYGNLTVLSAIEGLDFKDWDTPGVTGYWSVKNIISHLASFELVLEEILTMEMDGGELDILKLYGDDPGRFNDIQVDELRADLSPEAALAEYQEAFARSAALFAQFPEERLRINGIFPWYGAEYDFEDFIVYTFYGHKREHSAQINHFKDDVLEK